MSTYHEEVWCPLCEEMHPNRPPWCEGPKPRQPKRPLSENNGTYCAMLVDIAHNTLAVTAGNDEQIVARIIGEWLRSDDPDYGAVYQWVGLDLLSCGLCRGGYHGGRYRPEEQNMQTTNHEFKNKPTIRNPDYPTKRGQPIRPVPLNDGQFCAMLVDIDNSYNNIITIITSDDEYCVAEIVNNWLTSNNPNYGAVYQWVGDDLLSYKLCRAAKQ